MTPMNQSGRQGEGGSTKKVGEHQRKNQVTGIPGKERANRAPNFDPKTSHEVRTAEHHTHHDVTEHIPTSPLASQNAAFEQLLEKSRELGIASKAPATKPTKKM